TRGSAGAGGGAGGGSAGAGGGAGHESRDGGADAMSLPGTHNPVVPGLFADPHIAEFDGVFYIYPTTDGFANWGATSFSVFSSTNLVEWTNRGVILDLPKDLKWATDRAWAPAIARAGATYYFYFCAAQQIGVATSSSPTGPFKDALGHPLITTNQFGPQSIDPFFFLDDDGTRYLYFGSGTGGLRVVKLGSDMISLSGTPANISPSGASGVLEGSAMFKRNGTYYLQWSEGDTRDATYKVGYAKAASATGPFTRLATILQQDTAQRILGPGGSTVLAFPDRDAYYIAYHRFKIPGGDGTHRETCIDRLFFNADGTIAPVKPTLQGLQTAVAP
ncbi:MAG TPA: family 43 glycosylhydrolase, partial [Polyangia bacterium]|nr:family 43 glycosylhydrolase [Polyangia bacterium]